MNHMIVLIDTAGRKETRRVHLEAIPCALTHNGAVFYHVLSNTCGDHFFFEVNQEQAGLIAQ